MKSKWLHILLIILAYILTLLAVIAGAYFRAGLDVTEGSISTERIRAPHVLENVRETEVNRLAALAFAENLEVIYIINEDVWLFVENELLLLRSDIEVIRAAYLQELRDFQERKDNWHEEVEAITADFGRARQEWEAARDLAIAAMTPFNIPQPPQPPQPDAPELIIESLDAFADLRMFFSEEEQLLLVTRNDADFAMLWAAVIYTAEAVQINTQIDEIDFLTERAVTMRLSNLEGLDRAAEDLVTGIVLHHLRDNVMEDDERNRQRFEEHSSNYVRAWIQTGQIIVDEGETITADIYYLLGQLGLLRSDSVRENLVLLIGVGVLVALLFLICFMYISFYHPAIITSKKEAALLFTIFVLSLAVAWALRDFPVPVIALLMFPMLVSLLIDRRCAMVLSFAMVLVCFFVVEGTLAYLLFYTAASALICLLSRFGTERNKVFLVGLLVTAVQFGLAITVALIIERAHALSDLQSLLFTASLAAMAGMLTVIICTGSLPFWETVFGVVTPIKLLDLTNPTNLLLRRLTIEAPGTYHHSLIVANLAETAAYDIGANAHAARVGGYYHDVGKLKMPHYFVENIDGTNPHDDIEPINSAQIIINHVTHGLTLAEEHRLPQFVRDIIREHQGTTMIHYFYTKAKKADPDVAEDDYRYPFVIPQTRESACVMLADSVEAAVRAAMPKLNSVDEVEKIIRNVVRGKLNDGQLADSQLSIRDVTVIEQSFFRVLKGMYHERIVYPTVAKV